MKKSRLLIAPLLVVPFLASCGGSEEYKVSIPDTNGVIVTPNKATKGKEYVGTIKMAQDVDPDHILPDALDKVTSGNKELVATKDYTYTLKEDKLSADFKIPAANIVGDISVQLSLAPKDTKEKIYGHTFVYTNNYYENKEKNLKWLEENLNNIKFKGEGVSDPDYAHVKYYTSKEGEADVENFSKASYSDVNELLEEMDSLIEEETGSSAITSIKFNKRTGATSTGELNFIDVALLNMTVTDRPDAEQGTSVDFDAKGEFKSVDLGARGTFTIGDWKDDKISYIKFDLQEYYVTEEQEIESEYLSNCVEFCFPLKDQTCDTEPYSFFACANFLPKAI